MEKISSLLYFLCTGLTPRDSRDPGEPADSRRAQEDFWDELVRLDGLTFAGGTSGRPAAPECGFWQAPDAGAGLLTMRVERHSEREICMPLEIGDDRSRAWLIQRDSTGLRLRHERQVAGHVQWRFGGRAVLPGRRLRQNFGPDRDTQTLLPEAAHDTWSLELVPYKRLTYQWRRPSTRRRLQVEFDLAEPLRDVD